MPVTELYAFNLICENLLAALYGVALKIPKAACTENSKSSRVKVLSQTNLKLFHAGGLKPRDIPSGTAILVSAVRRRCGQIHFSFL